MDKDTFLSKISEIGTITDDVERRKLLTEVSDEVSKVFDNVDTLNSSITSLNEELTKSKEENEKTLQENMRLFLRVEEQKSTKQVEKEKTGVEQEPEKLSFDDLFKKEGNDK